MGLIRAVIAFFILIVFVTCGAKVKLGERTLFQHVSRIWQTEETQEMVNGVKEKSGPVVDKVKRGVKAGLKEATRDRDAGPR
jgi:hypothetical protein